MKTNNKHMEKQYHRTRNLAIWTGAWTASVALVSFGAKFLWDYNEILSVAAILISTLLGIGMIRSNIRHLLGQDELQQKITLDAMGIALGVALVGGISYSMLDVTNVIPFNAEISHLIILIGVSYILAILIGNSRYK